MEGLTVEERRILNNLSQVHNKDLKLGDKLQEIIDSLPKKQTKKPQDKK